MSDKYFSKNNMKLLIDGLKTGMVSNWNENNKNSFNYIKNRPFYEDETGVHHIDSKFIKDMYYQTSKEIFSVKKLQSESTDGVITNFFMGDSFILKKDKDYIVNWEGTEYFCSPYILEGVIAIGNSIPIFPEYSGNSKNEPFIFGYNGMECFACAYGDLIDGRASFSITEITYHTINPKYIKDMYYERETAQILSTDNDIDDLIDKYGYDLKFRVIINGITYEDVPLESGCYVAGGQTWGIGDQYYQGFSEDLKYGFCVSRYGTPFHPDFFPDGIQDVKVFIVSKEINQIKNKYLSMMGEDLGQIFSNQEVFNGDEFLGDYKMLEGPSIVIIDGNPIEINFIQESSGTDSIAQGENFFIASRNGGLFFDFSDNNPHSVEIISAREIVKKEYLPYSITAQPDWNQNAVDGIGYIKNRTHYDDYSLFRQISITTKPDSYSKNQASVYYCFNAIPRNLNGIKVIYDNVPYIIKDYQGEFGDSDLIEYPFYVSYSGSDWNIIYTDTPGEHTFEVYLNNFKQLDHKFIKDMYYDTTTEYGVVEIFEENNKKYLDIVLEKNRPYTILYQGREYHFDSLQQGNYYSAAGVYPWYIGAKPTINTNGVTVTSWTYPFSIYSTGFAGPDSSTEIIFRYEYPDDKVEILGYNGELVKLQAKYLPEEAVVTTPISSKLIARITQDNPVALLAVSKDCTYTITVNDVEYPNIELSEMQFCSSAIIPYFLDDPRFYNEEYGISIFSSGFYHESSVIPFQVSFQDKSITNYEITIVENSYNTISQEQMNPTLKNIGEIISKIAVQADWNESDPTSLSYIKNKPDENDALIIAVETGLVSPAAAEDGSIYTDENGVLYSL